MELKVTQWMMKSWYGVAFVMAFAVQLMAQQPGPPPNQQPLDPLFNLLMSQPRMALDAPVYATAEFDPPAVRPGNPAVYRVTINAMEDSIDWPGALKAPAELALRPGAHGQLLQMVRTNMEAKTTFLEHALPKAEGRYTVPSFTIDVYGRQVRVPEAQLQVSAAIPGSPQPIRLLLESPTTPVYVGQAIRPRVMLPFHFGHIQTLSQVSIEGQGFLSDQSGLRQRIEPRAYGATNLITFIYEPLLTPIAAGKLRFYAKGWSVVNHATGPIIITNNTVLNLRVEHTFVDSDPVEMEVKPLPPLGDLAGFVGAIGRFTNDPPKLSTNKLRVGDPLKVRVTIRGEGNIARLVPPAAPKSKEWQVFEASGDPTPAPVINAQGAITFTYTMIPLVTGAGTTPAIPFTYFNPYDGKYVDSKIPPVRVHVIAGPAGAAPEVFAQAEAREPIDPKEPKLGLLTSTPGVVASSLEPIQRRAWFPLIQVAPAVLFFSLWSWDRRRRFLAQHPDIILRRKARRALRRQRRRLNAAALQRDSAAFGKSAVDALRVAIAPHYPAEAHALVGRDVLQMLPEPDRNGRAGHAVRSVFEVTDANNFSAERCADAQLLAFEPDLHAVLDTLDSQLRTKSSIAWLFARSNSNGNHRG